ncbi:acyltransferase [Demequina sp. NBRC 110055]|uniref:acyltransferase n=1 Tax=Demequina sp. NBRC 110055 TaxID=1570344 RepID=UPI0011861ABD|nr:acyltransferase [Demequina sp. NBRC 110055]
MDCGAKLEGLDVSFDCNGGTMRIGDNPRGRKVTVTARIGEDSTIDLGDDLSTTGKLAMSVAEGGSIRIAAGVMVAAECQIRADDAHLIFSVHTGKRVNPVKDIEIGEHVWLGMRSVVLGGARIERGSVIGLGSVVTGHIPNNCIAVGAPARVVRHDIAWERTHLTLRTPYYKPDAASLGELSPYWDPTETTEKVSRRANLASRVKHLFTGR